MNPKKILAALSLVLALAGCTSPEGGSFWHWEQGTIGVDTP